MTPPIGSRAPGFQLANQFGAQLSLSDFEGKRAVVLVFFPLAFSRICRSELAELCDNLTLFEQAGAQLIGISVDSKASLRAWAEQEGFEFPLLADFWPHGAVAQQYGVLVDAAGYASRTTFVIDTHGIIRATFASAPGEPRTLEQYRLALEALP